MPSPRRPQINFQVDPAMKLLYEEAKISGHWVTRFCAAGLLLMVEDPVIRMRALNRLRDWEDEYQEADADEIRDFVQGAEAAMQTKPAGSSRPPRATPRTRRRIKRPKSSQSDRNERTDR